MACLKMQRIEFVSYLFNYGNLGALLTLAKLLMQLGNLRLLTSVVVYIKFTFLYILRSSIIS